MRSLVFEQVSKSYLATAGGPSLRNAVLGILAPQRRTRPELVRALTDVSFSLAEGDSLALMGANGSGKSTALKMVSQITYPTAGEIRVRGRVGALIEVGTGLHPELTGRENVYLYGRILGMSGRDVRSRFDRIVEFSELGGAIDRPVKQYSSGMQLRLGYSLASHLEPDILIVDEAISVGDAGFQQACLRRTAELVKSGVTLIFVSHSAGLVGTLCKQGLLLREGKMTLWGTASQVADEYLRTVGQTDTARWRGDGLGLKSWKWEANATDRNGHDLSIRLEFQADVPVDDPKVAIGLTDGRAINLVSCLMSEDGFSIGRRTGAFTVTCAMRALPLEPAPYQVWLAVGTSSGASFFLEPQPLGFIQLGEASALSVKALQAGTAGWAPVRVDHQWSID